METLKENRKLNFCIFCSYGGSKGLKSGNLSLSAGKVMGGEKNDFLQKFFDVLERYVGTKFNTRALLVYDMEESESVEKPSSLINTCQECVQVLIEFCKLYEQMEHIRLRLEWSLEKLIRKMELAEGSLSRVMHVQEESLEAHTELSGCVTNDDIATKEEIKKKDELVRNFKKFRKLVIEKCNNKIAKSKPEGLLERTMHPVKYSNCKSTVVLRQTPNENSTLLSSLAFVEPEGATGSAGFENSFKNNESAFEELAPEVKMDNYHVEDDLLKLVEEEKYNYEQYSDEEKFYAEDNNGSASDCSRNSAQQRPDSQERKRFSLRSKAVKYYQEEDGHDSSSDFETAPTKTKIKKPKSTKREGNHVYFCVLCSKSISRKYKGSVICHLRDVHSLSLTEAKKIFSAKIDNQNEKDEGGSQITQEKNGDETLFDVNTDKLFKCAQCSSWFSHCASLIQHTKKFHTAIDDNAGPTHPTGENCDRPFACSKCPGRFKYQKVLLSHVSKYHSKEPLIKRKPAFTCCHCQRSFSWKHSLKKHLKVRHSEKTVKSIRTQKSTLRKLYGSFQCLFCEAVKDYAPDLAVYELENHPPSELTETEENLQTTQTGKKLFKCARCEFKAIKRSKCIRHHVEEHLGLTVKTRCCEICQKPFSSVDGDSESRRHFESHHNTTGVHPSKIRKCVLCPSGTVYFLQMYQLIRHRRNIHQVKSLHKELRKKCMECHKTFSAHAALRHHMKTMHNFDDESPSLPFPCEKPGCKKRFSSKEEMEQHIGLDRHINRKVTKGQMLNCSVCNRQCKGVSGLKVHMKSHIGPSEFICEQCGLGFKTRTILKRHYLFHKSPDEWEYQCEQCGKKCQTKHHLSEHLRSHTGEKPFECKVCDRKYSRREKLRAHVNNKHKDVGVQDIARKMTKPKFISKRTRK